MIVYTGSIDDSHALIQFLRHEKYRLQALRKLVVSRESSIVQDVNGDGMEFPGLTYGCPALNRLAGELGIVFPSKALHDADSAPNGIREFDLSACWTWGYG